MRKIHFLKIKEKYFERIQKGEKTCEIRFNDRDFQKGDEIVFLTFKVRPSEEIFEGDYLKHLNEPFSITHVLHFPDGLREGYVALSINPTL